jgi:sulfate adenylyltransferase subunit 1
MRRQEAWKEERERGISRMRGLLKFITCGSVDDGKSTLIGHILYDAKLLYADQEKALELDSKVGSRGGAIDYSLLLDGLMAEREQGITIDVAYRYFTTDNRSFIVADTPGHEEYTRNMAVGASFADLAIILVDAKQGVLVQTRRHARICSLMGIKYFVFAVNKMDLVGYDEARFNEITAQIDELKNELKLESVVIIPVSATEGDNVTKKSDNLPWYKGEAILPYLETVDVTEKKHEEGFYMPVQRVCRPDHTFRGFQGQIESGTVKVGEEIVTLPSNEHAHVKSILVGDKNADEAFMGQPVTIQLDKEVDVSRGCVLSSGTTLPLSKSFTATILWMDDTELTEGKDYLVKIGTKQIPGILKNIQYKIDVNTGEYIPASVLKKNEIALCDISLQEAIVLDEFTKHKTLGELILIDRVTNMTSACGVIADSTVDEHKALKAAFVYENLKANGDIFEEFYYNLDSMTINKVRPNGKTYTVGDEIPVNGETYQYPNDFDIVVLRDKVAVSIRGAKVEKIYSLADYSYSGVPVINGRGFGVNVTDEASAKEFLKELEAAGESIGSEFFNKWVEFGRYRRIVFRDEIWN